MNRTPRSLIALAAATTVTAALAVPAVADDHDLIASELVVVTDMTTWCPWFGAYATEAFSISEAQVHHVVPAEWGCSELTNHNDDAFDGAWVVGLAPDAATGSTYFGHNDPVKPSYVVDYSVAANGDHVVTAPSEEILGLQVSVEHRYYAAGDLARVLVTVTNPSEASVTVVARTESGFGSNGSTTLVADSTDDGSVTLADDWMVASDNGTWDPVITSAWSHPASGVRHNLIERSGEHGSTDVLETAAEITVPAGATVRLAYFSALYGYDEAVEKAELGEGLAATIIADDYATAAATATTAAAEFDTFAGRLVAGLAPGTVVLNWGTVPAAPAGPATPVTGDPTFTG